MLKLIRTLSLPCLLLLSATSAQALGRDCDTRRAEVENKIEQAKAHNNHHALAGLEKALRDINTYCNDESLIADGRKKVTELEAKLDKKKNELSEIQADWHKERAKNGSDTKLKYHRKQLDKQEEINEVQQNLNVARDELTALKAKVNQTK